MGEALTEKTMASEEIAMTAGAVAGEAAEEAAMTGGTAAVAEENAAIEGAVAGDSTTREATGTADGILCAREPVSGFDDIIGDLRKLDFPRTARVELDALESEVPLVYGEGAGGGVVMRRDIGAELGGGNAPTCAMVLTTSNTSLVHDGRVTIVGPDADELPTEEAAPFAQVILVGGSGLRGADVQALEEAQKVRNWVRGYQVRTTTDEIAARVSGELMERGFSLAHLGRALMELVRSIDERVESAEVMFVTSSSEDVRALRPLARRWTAQSHELRRCAMAEVGIDIDCPSGGHCGKCKDKDTCDQVRRIQALRRNAKRTEAA